jgi:16S rRNA (cytidine1402-2'-O)-methyltransferase
MPLYLVGTPIGNMEDITLRALRVLREASLIAAEDTRTSRKLLNHYDIKSPLTSYHDFSTPDKVEQLIERLQASDVALISDAGMPGLSDPGYRLVAAALEAGIQVIPVPGPSAAVTALVASGMPTDSFLFLGFLPRQKKARRAALAQVQSLPYTLVIYEAPHRLLDTLADIERVLGERQLCVGRELTKLHEEIWRGMPGEAMAHFGQDRVRGEITLMVAGASQEEGRWEQEMVLAAVTDRLAAGLSRKDASAEISALSGWRKKEVYELSLGDS